jgi:hypothetical protein
MMQSIKVAAERVRKVMILRKKIGMLESMVKVSICWKAFSYN